MDTTWFVGKKIVSITRDKEANEITFIFEGGLSKRLGVTGPSSWIEHLEMPPDVVGATIQSVDEPEMAPWDQHECSGEVDYSRPCGHVLAFYHTRFRTDKGDVVLEYRNDSNGYYGGSLTDEGEAK